MEAGGDDVSLLEFVTGRVSAALCCWSHCSGPIPPNSVTQSLPSAERIIAVSQSGGFILISPSGHDCVSDPNQNKLALPLDSKWLQVL